MTEPATPKKSRGRPRLTAEALQSRIDAYCARYDVRPGPNGLPPFPAGRRETPQHRQWIALYTASRRLRARDRPNGSPTAEVVPAAELRAWLGRQSGRCAACARKLVPADAVADDGHAVHARCHQIVALARGLDPKALDSLRAYLSCDG
jgi:hypothetical protein